MLPSGSPLSAGTPTRLEITSATPGNIGAAAADEDLIGLRAAAAGGQIELQRAAHLLSHVVDEGVQHFGLIVARQTALFLGAPGLLHGEAVGAHDLFGELLSTEGEITGVDDFHVAQHAERGAARAEVDDRHGAVHAAVGHLMTHERAGVLEGERLHIDDMGGESGRLHGGLALLHVLGAGGDQKHVQHVRILVGRTHDLVVVADFFHGEGDVLVGLHLDLSLELVLAEALGHLDDFGDGRIARNRDGGEAALGARALDRAADGFTDRLRIHDGFLVDGVVGSRLRRIRLHPVLATRQGELDQLHRGGGDVQPQ